jgi:hypothetical protein
MLGPKVAGNKSIRLVLHMEQTIEKAAFVTYSILISQVLPDFVIYCGYVRSLKPISFYSTTAILVLPLCWVCGDGVYTHTAPRI